MILSSERTRMHTFNAVALQIDVSQSIKESHLIGYASEVILWKDQT